MKKLYIIVLSLFFSFSTLAYASVESLLKTPVSMQHYESAGSSNASNNPQESYTQQLAKVRAIMEKAKKEAKEGKLKSTPHALTLMSQPSAKPVENPTNASTISEVAKELESQMNQMHQVNLQYQQSTNQKIETLTSQNKMLSSRLQKLTQAMLMMNQQLSSMSHSRRFHQSDLPTVKTSHHSVTFSSIFKYLAFGVAALLAVLMGILISRQKKA